MVLRLCENIRAFTGRMPQKRQIPAASITGGRHSVTLYEIHPFIELLPQNEQQRLLLAATGDWKRSGLYKEGRKVLCGDYSVENYPLLGGREVRQIRLKGALPRLQNRNVVRRYKGLGYVDKWLIPMGECRLGTKRADNNIQFFHPDGSMRKRTLEREVLSALQLGGQITDVVLGFGLYDDLVFDGDQVGFVVYGLEVSNINRVSDAFDHILFSNRREEFMLHLVDLTENSGRMLARVHREHKLSHSYAYPMNYRRFLNGEVRLLDLDTMQTLKGYSPEEIAVRLFIDLNRAAWDHYRIDNCWFSGIPEEHWLLFNNRAPFLAHWLKGYFDEYPGLYFTGLINAFLSKNPRSKWSGSPANMAAYEEIFGCFPEQNMRRTDHVSSLVEPARQLIYNPNVSEVNLAECKDRIFKPFFDALLHVAAAI
ncbi:MAG: hypothetical protein WC890_07195 [Candidatus Margulisiibacteriota bacterium]